MMTDRPLCFIDTETTGLHDGREAWEIALFRDDDGATTTRHLFLRVGLHGADPKALQVGGFYERHPAGKATVAGKAEPWVTGWDVDLDTVDTGGVFVGQEVAAREVARMTHDATLIGLNPGFDAHIFTRLLREHGMLPTWDYHLMDLRPLMIGWLLRSATHKHDMPTLLASRTDGLIRMCLGREPVVARHTAMGDVDLCRMVWEQVTT